MSQLLADNSAVLHRMIKQTRTLRKSYAPSIVQGGSTQFDLDDEIVNSQAYRRAFYAFMSNTTSGAVTDKPSEPHIDALQVNELNSDDVATSLPRGSEGDESPTVSSSQPEISDSVRRIPGLSAQDQKELNLGLLQAAESCHDRLMQHYLDAGAGLNITGKDDFTPLHFAAKHGYIACIRILLARGADVEKPAPSYRGSRPLHIACEFRHVQAVELLLVEGKADIHARITSGNRPLNLAIIFGILATVRVLVEAGADIEADGVNGWTPLQHAAYNSELAKAAYLLERGAKVTPREADGNTALHFAAQKGSVGLVELLLKYGAQTEVCNNAEERPLHCAASAGQSACVESLLDHGAAVNAMTGDGSTPLHFAAHHGHFAQFRFWSRKVPTSTLPKPTAIGP